MTMLNTSNGSLLTNNFLNSTYSIDTTNGTIKINEVGIYDIMISSDYYLDSSNILNI